MPIKPTIVASAMSESVVKQQKSQVPPKKIELYYANDGPGSISAKLGKALS